MKKLGIIVCFISCVILLAECKKGNTVHDGILSIKDAGESQEVTFEDVVTDVRIVPLISDEPIDELTRIKCYGSTVVIRTGNLYSLYVFDNGKFVGKLNRSGRGHGEYLYISDFVYSPTRKVLYVRSTSSIMSYSVPDMNYIGSFDLPSVTAFAEHDDSTLIVKMKYEGKNGIYYVNANNGQIMGKLKDISGIDAIMNEDMFYYSPRHRILSVYGNPNTISEVPESMSDEERILLEYDFGRDGVPVKYEELNDRDVDMIMDLFKYMSDNKETMVTGMTYFSVDTSSTSFSLWYNVNDKRYYARITGDDVVKYSGFRASGMRDAIVPNGLTDDGYVRIIQGTVETVFNSSERSDFSANLEKAMKSQTFDNPVLVFFSIR